MEDIVVQVTGNLDKIEFDAVRIEKLVQAVCTRFELRRATVSIAVVDTAEIRRVNEQYLDHDRTTDVISFDLSEGSDDKVFDVVINAEKAVEQACSRGHSSQSEAALYIVHGLLHNLGFDDSSAKQAKAMHAMEDEILEQQGFGAVFGN